MKLKPSLPCRVLTAVLILVISAGGSGFPVLDALVFHGSSRGSESYRAHYEATSGCHGDGCTIRSVAQSRYQSDLAPHGFALLPPLAVPDAPATSPEAPAPLSFRYLSRAPPRNA